MEGDIRSYFLDGRAIAMATMPYVGGAVISMSYLFSEAVVTLGGTPTMGVTDKGQLLVHPKFIELLVEGCGGTEAAGFVVLHEVFHILFGHTSKIVRMREKHGDNFDEEISGLAIDFTINPMLRATAKKRGKRWWIREPTGVCAGVFPENYGLPDGLRYEDYYDLLVKQGGSRKKAGGRSGQGCSPITGGELAGEMGEAAGKLPEWSKVRAESVLREVLAEAKKAEERQKGSVPAGLMLSIEEMLEPPKVDWRSELFSQMCEAIEHIRGGGDNSYLYVSRRQAGLGYGVGAPRLPGSVEPIPSVVVVWDTSGSMYGNLNDLVRETLAIAETLNVEVTTIACDASANAAVKIGNLEAAKAALVGGGGTCMTPAFIEAKKHRPSLVICITDGMIEDQPYTGHGFPVLWVLVNDYTRAIKPSLDAGWGRYIVITKEDMK